MRPATCTRREAPMSTYNMVRNYIWRILALIISIGRQLRLNGILACA